ncbi:MAG: SPOR domain-containing protein [Bacteroidota bacterium]|nr:SPOR domain-containing protein [Bacteroidota bacterium]MEC8031242.1 SPOR domain-containing protein [Bacteroidota bacterium]
MFKLRYIFVVSFSIFYLIGNAQVLDDADGNVQDSIDIFQEVDAIAPLDSIIENTTDSINNEDLEIEPTDEFDDSVPNVEDAESSEDFDFYPIDEQEKDFESSTEDEFIFKPQVSLGTGMLTFYGDIGSNHQGYHPMVSRLATTLRLINPLNDFLDLGFYVLFGQISANERTLTRNLNFNSNITTGGVTINYNFNQFLRKGRNVEPYIHVGLESIEFLSKTDLQDANGNTYHYWSDGSIKDLAENDPNADNAIDLVRDYTYESDIREQNFDGFGKYQERTLGIPLELGANFHVGNKLKFRVGTAVHFTFTDLIDGVTNESVGNRIGDARNDKLLYTHIAMSYDFNIKSKKKPKFDVIDEDSEQYYREDTIDSDGDMVVDHMDRCANTPPGVVVDELGCPLDDDLDGVANSFDDELLSMEGALVDMKGVTMTDDQHIENFRRYKDSIGEFTAWDTLQRTWSSDPRSLKTLINTKTLKPKAKELYVVVGSDIQGVSEDELWKKLANRDFQVKESGDSILYVMGGYDPNMVADVIKELEEDSVQVQGVVEINDQDEITSVDVDEIVESIKVANESQNNETGDDEFVPVIDPETQLASFRIQIGAFSRKISKSVFADLPEVVSVKGDDGLYRYFSGSYTDKSKAASHKVNLTTSGYNDAFIVAFKDGKRVTLREAGFDVKPGLIEDISLSSTPSVNAVDPKLVKFRVQVGAFKEKVPTDYLDLFLDIGNVLPKKDVVSGFTRYYVGKLDTYEQAMAFRDRIAKKGLEDCFIVGEFKQKIIPSREALNLLGK